MEDFSSELDENISEIVLTNKNMVFNVSFISDEEVHELIGRNNFKCSKCEKVCKSQRGLNMHMEKKYPMQPTMETNSNADVPSSTVENDSGNYMSVAALSSLKDKVHSKMTVKGIFSDDILRELPDAFPQSFCSDVSALAQKFIVNKNKESFYTKYGQVISDMQKYFPH